MDRPAEPDLAARLFAGPERALVLMRAAWPTAVGPELARRTEIAALEKGVLRVFVPDATWQRNLGRMRGDILRRLRRVAGRAAPRALAFVEGPVAPPPPEAVAPAAPPSRPLPDRVASAAAAIPDEVLRREFLAVAERYLSRFGEPSGRSE